MSKYSAASSLILFTLVWTQHLCGQEPSFNETHFYTSFYFDTDCKPLVSFSRSRGPTVDHRLFLIEQETILDEIEANQDQRQELKKLASWHREKLKSIRATRLKRRKDEAQAEQEAAKKEADQRLHKILLDYQLKLMDTAQQRIYLRRMGVLEFLNRGEIGKEMKLKPHQLKKIESTINELSETWKKAKKKKSRLLADKLLEALDEQQRKTLKAKYGSKIYEADFEVRLIQLGMLANDLKQKSPSRSTKYLQAMTDVSQYVVEFDGSLKQQKTFERVSEGSTAFFLMRYVATEGFFSKKVLADSAIQEWNAVRKKIYDDVQHLSVVHQKEVKSGIEPQQADDNQRESMLEIYERAKKWVDENLEEEQAKYIVEQLQVRSLRCNGLLYELLGSTGKELGLDRKQKKRLKGIATEEFERFADESMKFETRLFSEVHKSLSRNQSKLLSPVTRWRPRKLWPNVTLLLLDNRKWPRTLHNIETGKEISR